MPLARRSSRNDERSPLKSVLSSTEWLGVNVDLQLLKKRYVATKVSEDSWELVREDGQGFESTNMRDCRSERNVDIFSTEVDFQRRRLRTLNVGTSFVDVREVKFGPQRGTGCKCVPPDTAHVCQRDQVSISAMSSIIVRDERKNFRRDPVYGCEQVLHRSDQSEQL